MADAASQPEVERMAEVLDALARDVWDHEMEESPMGATYVGDNRADDRLDEIGDAARSRRLEAIREFRRRLAAIPPQPPGGESELTRRVLDRSLALAEEEYDHRGWEWDVDQLFGLHLRLQNLMSIQPLGDDDACDRLIRRLGHVPRIMDEQIENLRAGMASGRTPPRLAVERVVQQLDTFANTPVEETPFVGVAGSRGPGGWDDARKAAWRMRLKETAETHVRPAYGAYLAFLRDELLDASRTDVGIWAIPGGAEAYDYRVRNMTTTDLTPDEIHEVGLEELERNKAEMLDIARGLGHQGELRVFLDEMQEDPQFRLTTREEILDRYRSICARMDEALPRVFGRLPKVGYEVKSVEPWREKDAPAAFYQRPPEDRSRPGVFYANTNNPSAWPTYDFEPLCFHEAVPGHHLQIALAQELEGIPKVRTYTGFTAYVEGWAHYTERLADEMGMYSTPYDRIGMLSAQAWRAVRLIVDTGIHAKRWTRQQAMDLMRSIRMGPDADVLNEVDRYIIWPGQALSYKVGSRTITAIREACRERLGERFDLKAFHDEILRHGALPLTLLEEVMSTWEP
ncbi:MAG: DUF885 domain-containing protein [Planctomycetota bacterium]